MVGGPAHTVTLRIVVTGSRNKISVWFRADLGIEQRSAFLCAEDDVHEQVSKGLRHGGIISRALRAYAGLCVPSVKKLVGLDSRSFTQLPLSCIRIKRYWGIVLEIHG